MNLSYWEIKSWLSNIDHIVVGSGIVGLNCALQLKRRLPKSNVLVLEKGMLPQGASTKNAGFACFGSLSEIINDLRNHTEIEVRELVKKRVQGLSLLRETLGDERLGYQQWGGYELYKISDGLFEACNSKKDEINDLLRPLFKEDVFSFRSDPFGFQNCHNQLGFNQFEGQIDTGRMMEALLEKAQKEGIKILNNVTVQSFSEQAFSVRVKTNAFEVTCSNLFVATNGFATQQNITQVSPARAQVLITKPIQDLKIKGTFHFDQGYYYFRNIDDRILFGGGRNLDIQGEETTVFAQTDRIQNALEDYLKTTILPNTSFEIEHRWSGIMGVGSQKSPILKQISNNIYCGVRLGGMGVAIGSSVGKDLANLLD